MRTTLPPIRKASSSAVKFSNSFSSSSFPRNDLDNNNNNYDKCNHDEYEDAPDDEVDEVDEVILARRPRTTATNPASWSSPPRTKPKPVLITPTSLKSLREGGTILYRNTSRTSRRTLTTTATDREPSAASNRRSRGNTSRLGAADDDDERPSYIIAVPMNDDSTLISSLAEEFRGSRPLPPPRTMVFHRKEVPGSFDVLDYQEYESGGCQGIPASSQDIPLFSLLCPVPENAQELLFGGGDDGAAAAAAHDDEENERPCSSSPTTRRRRPRRGSHPPPRDVQYLNLKHSPSLDKIIPPVSSSSTSSSTRSSPSSAVARELEQLFHQAQSTITEHVDHVRLQLTALQSSWLPPIPAPTTSTSRSTTSTRSTCRRRRRSNESDPGGPLKMHQQQHQPLWVEQPSLLSAKGYSYGEDSLWNFQEDDEDVDDANSTKASVIIHILQQ
jgi:hypothetical protein